MVGNVDDFRISIDVIGDELDPDEVSALLGSQPTVGYRKGDSIYGNDGSFRRHAKSGLWSIALMSRDSSDPESDFDSCLTKMIDSLTGDVAVWKSLAERFDLGLVCSIFLTDSNRGFNVSVELMSALAARGLHLGLDIYAPDTPE